MAEAIRCSNFVDVLGLLKYVNTHESKSTWSKWSVISTVVSNMKDFSRSQAFTCHVVPCTTFGKRSLKYKGSHLWNRLPESLKLIQSTPLFKSSLMVFLLTTV